MHIELSERLATDSSPEVILRFLALQFTNAKGEAAFDGNELTVRRMNGGSDFAKEATVVSVTGSPGNYLVVASG